MHLMHFYVLVHAAYLVNVKWTSEDSVLCEYTTHVSHSLGYTVRIDYAHGRREPHT